jgi:hypothetical protein
MRQFVSNLLIFPDVTPNSDGNGNVTAGTIGGQWQSQVYVKDYYNLGALAHEFNHLLDESAFQDLLASEGVLYHHDSRRWQVEAYDKDPWVPTWYSRSSWAEDFADAGRWALSEMAHQGGGKLAQYSSNWVNARNQFLEHINRFKTLLFPGSGRCTGKVSSSQPVRMDNGQPTGSGTRKPVEDGVPEIPKPNTPPVRYVYPSRD